MLANFLHKHQDVRLAFLGESEPTIKP